MMKLKPGIHIHLIGIGGTGLSAIATVLLECGFVVSGSDRNLSPFAQVVQNSGGQIYIGHKAENVAGADLVIRSSAVSDDNVEVLAARNYKIPIMKRSEFIGQLLADYREIAVAGTHGKTTTTAMIAWVLTALGQDPSFIIGGVAYNLASNAHAGRGQSFVIEADEYDRMFIGLNPQIAVVTNVEHDHPDCFPTPEDYQRVFYEFVDRLTPTGVLLACKDDPGAERLLEEAVTRGHRTCSYGLGLDIDGSYPDYYGLNLHTNEVGGYSFEILVRKGLDNSSVCVHLRVPGKHNVLNALAVIGVVDQMGLSLEEAAQALAEFIGSGRRFEVCGEAGGVTIVDDYAHHPTEIRSTLSAARDRYPGRGLWAVWQPHTYSRTRTLIDQFATAFEKADHVIITEIYPAREKIPEDGFSARLVVAAMKHPDVTFIPELSGVTNHLISRLHSGDIVLILSAGDADRIGAQILDAKRMEASN